MRIHTPEKVCTAVHIQNNPVPSLVLLFPNFLSLVVIIPHLNPLSSQILSGPAPLPPLLPTNSLYPLRPELRNQRFRGGFEVRVGDAGRLSPHPVRTGDPLAGEFLEVFNGLFRREDEKFAHDVDAFIIGDVDGGGVVEGFSV